MSRIMEALGIDRLSVEERMQLVEEIWDSIAADSAAFPLTDEQKREFDRRLAAHEANPSDVIPWGAIKSEAQSRFQR